MVAAARHDAILRELELRGSLENAGFARRLGVSAMTLRRDLLELEQRGLVVRVHGGATSPAVAAQQERAGADRAPAATRPVATIGMIVPTTNYYFPEVIRGASQAARELNCRLVVGATNYSPAEELRQAQRLIAGGVDALMITPHDSIRDEVSPLRDLLESARIPVVLVERSVEESTAGRFEWVRSDHVYGAEMAVRHLMDEGHRRIALAARPAATVASLHEGFDRAMRRLNGDGYALRRDLTTPRVGENVTIAELNSLLDDCIEQGVTAAVILGDADSMALTDLVIERGLRIPDDFAVVAYDDEISALAAVPLTAVAPPKHELGHAAVRLCVDRLRQPEGAPHTIVRMTLLPSLVVRDSTVRT
jgi:DNA-binding LacI/PurR family transcriptional regulator